MKETLYRTNQHSCYLLEYHLVLVTRYRHPVITGELKEKLYKHAQQYFSERKYRIIAMNGEADHVHILFEGRPNMNVKDVISAYKSASSRYIRQLFKEALQPYYWKPYFWSHSYFIGSVSPQTDAAVQRYIEQQGQE